MFASAVAAMLVVELFAVTPAKADFTGFYGGLNGGYAKGVDQPDPGRPQRLRSAPPSVGAAAATDGAEAKSPLLRREDLPASMRAEPRSLDGR